MLKAQAEYTPCKLHANLISSLRNGIFDAADRAKAHLYVYFICVPRKSIEVHLMLNLSAGERKFHVNKASYFPEISFHY